MKNIIEEDEMRQVRIRRRIAVVACVAMLGIGATACGSSDVNNDTPQAPTPTAAQPAATPAPTPSPTTSPQSGGAGF